MSQKKSAPQIPIANMRAKLLADPDTQRIAKDVGMELEAYVELVLQYLSNPEKEPQLYVAPDEELRELGYDPPSPEEVGQFLVAGARGDLGIGNAAAYKSQYEESGETTGPSLRGDEEQEQAPVDEETSQELLKHVPKQGPRRV